MNTTHDVVLAVIAIMAVITFVISYRALAKTDFGGIIIPLAIAGLSFLGLWTLARGWIEFVLVEYATLALCLLAIGVIVRVFGKLTTKTNTPDCLRKPFTPFKGKG